MSKKAKSEITVSDLFAAIISGPDVAYANTKALLEEAPSSVLNDQDYGDHYTSVTPLMFACVRWCKGQSSLDVVKLLLETPGVNINAVTTRSKRSALQIAVAENEESFPDCVRLLLSHDDIGLHHREDNGWTAQDIAVIMGKPLFLRMLLLHPNSNGQLLIYSMVPNIQQCLMQLVSNELIPRLHLPMRRIDVTLADVISRSTRLLSFSCFNWEDHQEILSQNGSIVDMGDAHCPPWAIDLCRRNWAARIACVKAALMVGGHLRKTQCWDMARLFMSWIWDTRGERAWIKKSI